MLEFQRFLWFVIRHYLLRFATAASQKKNCRFKQSLNIAYYFGIYTNDAMNIFLNELFHILMGAFHANSFGVKSQPVQ